ncbi:MAG: hypothetical protein JO117_08600 [Verrucomicrobia bacterium]|nr:hypothetical protein [Verrucomicrobiota bacterium]MBV9659315.1 hypothetical protein [Verrucomicrobiota bacterium]
MKTPLLSRAPASLCLLTLAGLSLPSLVWAQASPSPAPGVPPSPQTGADAGNGERQRLLAQLTPEERQKLKAAHDAALRDPAVQALEGERTSNRPAFQRAVREAMLRADPSVGPILEKMRGARGQTQTQLSSRLALLTPEEQAQLRAARQSVRNDPAVVSARQAVASATTPDARQQARRALVEAMQSAMLKKDPSIAPILEKMRRQNSDREVSDL